jgi:phage tail sheath protein FI
MPPTFTYPGVYIEELSSGVHTITGVATSIGALIGWAPKGRTDRATLVESFSDFAGQFGGLDIRSYLGYAVNHFFSNGGQQAYIVRLAWTDAVTAFNNNIAGTLDLFASSPGQWGNNVQVSVTQAADGIHFLLQVLDASTTPPAVVESYPNLSIVQTDSQYVVTVINNDSQYITFVNPVTGIITPPGIVPSTTPATPLANGLDGTVLNPNDGNFETALLSTTAGLSLLDRVDIFNLLGVPGETEVATVTQLEGYCKTRRAFYIVDPPQAATATTLNTNGPQGTTGGALAALSGGSPDYAAYYFPWVSAPDPLAGNRPRLFPPCGFVGGIYAATDASRGIWKAPAGIDASLTGVSGLQYVLTDKENGNLNPQAINCLRDFKVYGNVVWGARTLAGNDQTGSQWKYVPIRRLALYLESSLYDGTQWVVFEPNDEKLWSQIRLNVGAFMQGLFLQGAFQGTTPQQAYLVKCDGENNPQSSIDMGVVNILVGFAPLYPAEFVLIQIQQLAGQLQA